MSTLYSFLSKYLTINTLITQEQQIFSRLHNINTDMGDGEIQEWVSFAQNSIARQILESRKLSKGKMLNLFN
jgi:hypothetical protein